MKLASPLCLITFVSSNVIKFLNKSKLRYYFIDDAIAYIGDPLVGSN